MKIPGRFSRETGSVCDSVESIRLLSQVAIFLRSSHFSLTRLLRVFAMVHVPQGVFFYVSVHSSNGVYAICVASFIGPYDLHWSLLSTPHSFLNTPLVFDPSIKFSLLFLFLKITLLKLNHKHICNIMWINMLFKEFEISLLTNEEGGGCNLSRLGSLKHQIHIDMLIRYWYVSKEYPIFYI
jgi:hypothetical protein